MKSLNTRERERVYDQSTSELLHKYLMNHIFNNNVSINNARVEFKKKKWILTTIDFIAKGSYTVSLSINH